MSAVELSENAETLLQRILDKNFLPGIKSITMRESMVEHLIIEEARRLKVIDMKEGIGMMIELSKTAEILLKRIVESRLGSGSGSGLHLMCDCMIEHLIHEEARRLKVTDQDLEAKE